MSSITQAGSEQMTNIRTLTQGGNINLIEGNVTNDHNVSSQTLFLQNLDLSVLEQSQEYSYDIAQQLLARNGLQLPSLAPASSALREFYSTTTDVATYAQQIQAYEAQVQVYADEAQALSRQVIRGSQQGLDQIAAQDIQAKMQAAKSQTSDMGTPAHIGALNDLIGSIHNDYQKTYAKINEKAAEYMKDINTALGTISGCIDAGSDGKINFNAKQFCTNMWDTMDKYVDGRNDKHIDFFFENNPVAKPIYNFSGDEKAAKFWSEKLGSSFNVTHEKNVIKIFPNLEPIGNVFKTIKGTSGPWDVKEMPSQSFQAMQTPIDSQKNGVNSGVSQLLERFRQDNSTFETLIQLLTKMTEDLHRYNAAYIQ